MRSLTADELTSAGNPAQLIGLGVSQNASCAVGNFVSTPALFFPGGCGSLIVHIRRYLGASARNWRNVFRPSPLGWGLGTKLWCGVLHNMLRPSDTRHSPFIFTALPMLLAMYGDMTSDLRLRF